MSIFNFESIKDNIVFIIDGANKQAIIAEPFFSKINDIVEKKIYRQSF